MTTFSYRYNLLHMYFTNENNIRLTKRVPKVAIIGQFLF